MQQFSKIRGRSQTCLVDVFNFVLKKRLTVIQQNIVQQNTGYFQLHAIMVVTKISPIFPINMIIFRSFRMSRILMILLNNLRKII